jgi:hypothetical protein
MIPIVFPAEHRQVDAVAQYVAPAAPEHCELLEQMMPSLAGQLNFKVISKQLSCDGTAASEFRRRSPSKCCGRPARPPGEKK